MSLTRWAARRRATSLRVGRRASVPLRRTLTANRAVRAAVTENINDVPGLRVQPTFRTAPEYERAHRYSIEHADEFWSAIGNTFHWYQKPNPAAPPGVWNFDPARAQPPLGSQWYSGATTNLCYNALDRHCEPLSADGRTGGRGSRVALHWEAQNGLYTRSLTYDDLLQRVLHVARAMQRHGLQKGDRVTLMLPTVPELVICVLACARLGLVHSVLGWLGAGALADRVFDARPKLVITTDAFWDCPTGGTLGECQEKNVIWSKRVVDDALDRCSALGYTVPHVVVVERLGGAYVPPDKLAWRTGRDIWYHDFTGQPTDAAVPGHGDAESARKASSIAAAYQPTTRLTPRDVPCVEVGAEDPACILYTSGSTGKPKGVVHHAGGYMVFSATSFKYGLNVSDDDVYFCPNVNWVLYGPLCNATTQVLVEANPFFPSPGRMLQMAAKYKVTNLYGTANAMRLLQASDPKTDLEPYLRDGQILNRLKLIGTLGEPLSDAQWQWCWSELGQKRVPIVDTWWQTETGGIMMNSLHDNDALVKGSGVRARSMRPFFGVEPALLDSATLREIAPSSSGGVQDGTFVLKRAWPSTMRTVWPDDRAQLRKLYFNPAPGYFWTGDGARRDAAGNYVFTGRVDDVFIVHGTRISAVEMEGALMRHPSVAEAAVVGFPHPVSGIALYAWIQLRPEVAAQSLAPAARQALEESIRVSVIPLLEEMVEPAVCTIVPALPKTRTGKILRRALKTVISQPTDPAVTVAEAAASPAFGDTTAMANAQVLPQLVEAFRRNPLPK